MKLKLVYIILLSVLLRVGAALYLGNEVVDLPGTADQVSYHNLAMRVVDGYGFSFGQAWWPVTAANAPTAHWSFIYTLFLAAIYALFGINPIIARLIQAVIVGVLHPYFVFALASLIVNEFNSKRGDGVGERIRGNGRLTGHVLPYYFLERVPLLAAGITAVYFYFIYYIIASCEYK